VRLQIYNEYDKLEAVLVHRPGQEIDRLTHDNMAQFLFEDVPFLRRMQEEHDAFVAKMRDHGVEVVYLEQLLLDVLRDESHRNDIVASVCRTAMIPAIADDLASLKYWDAEALVEILFAGITAGEYHRATGQRIAADGAARSFLIPPVPNAYFSRDPAVVVHDTIISSKMHYRERVRESVLTRAVLEKHPDFRDSAITYGSSSEPTEDRPYTIEGGDVLVLSREALLVGASERTRSETIELLAGKFFALGNIKRVYEIPIPSKRAFMHLDTVFTIVDRGMVLSFAPVMKNIGLIHRYEPGDDGRAVRAPDDRGLVKILGDEFGTEVTVIETAGGSEHFAAREQRTDGTNALAIAPRLVVAYERNERTVHELEAHGVTCIGVDDSELVRGLGGPRCMTMPLRRSSS
jgi:arginine deiminase